MKKLITVLALVAPSLALAQTAQVYDANSLVYKLTGLGNTFIQILIAFAVIWIIWNVVMFIFKADDEEARGKYRSAFLWGIVGLAVMLSIWGLVAILTNTFRVTGTPTGQTPVIQVPISTP